jgi:preprotein translocase subunit SecG
MTIDLDKLGLRITAFLAIVFFAVCVAACAAGAALLWKEVLQ